LQLKNLFVNNRAPRPSDLSAAWRSPTTSARRPSATSASSCGSVTVPIRLIWAGATLSSRLDPWRSPVGCGHVCRDPWGRRNLGLADQAAAAGTDGRRPFAGGGASTPGARMPAPLLARSGRGWMVCDGRRGAWEVGGGDEPVRGRDGYRAPGRAGLRGRARGRARATHWGWAPRAALTFEPMVGTRMGAPEVI